MRTCCDAQQDVEPAATEAPAEVSCTECGRRPLPGERWSLRFADLGEVAVYCPECDDREFAGAPDLVFWRSPLS